MGTVNISASGDMGAGKSVVLNIIAQALEEKGIKVTRSRGVPTLDPEWDKIPEIEVVLYEESV